MPDGTGAAGRHDLRRTLRLGGVVLFGLAYIAPMSVYAVYGELDQLSRGTPAGAYLLALAAMLLTALSYGRMVTIYPVAGSAYTYVRRTIGGHVGFLVGWAAVLDYMLLPMAAWLIASAFIAPIVPGVPTWAWIVAFASLTTAVNVAGLVLANRVNLALVVIELVVIAAFIALAGRYVWLASGPSGLVSAKPFFQADVPLSATLAGASLAAVSFLGFDAVTTLSEETVDARRTMRRAILIIAVTCGMLFIVSAYMTALAHPSIHFRDMQAATEEIASPIGGNLFKAVFIFGAVMTQLAAGVATQASSGRLLFAMGRDGVLPRPFAFIHPALRTPTVNITLTGLIGLLGIMLSVQTAVSFVNFGAFVAFTFVNLSVIVHALRTRVRGGGVDLITWFLLPSAGAAGSFWLLMSLETHAHILGGIWLALGVLYLLVLTRGLRRPPPEMAVDGDAAPDMRSAAAGAPPDSPAS